MIKVIIIFMFIFPAHTLQGEENYSREMQQAIRLYEEGKNTDAMDRFMDILVSGSPEEKSLANEYITKITNGVPPQTSIKDNKKITVVNTPPSNSSTKTQVETREISDEEVILKKVSDKIKQIKSDILIDLYRKRFIKLYMDESNQKPNYILIKEDQIFNDDLTFNQKVMDDLKKFAGLFTALGKVSVTIAPNGSITGNMKISNVRKASILHSYLISYGLSPTKVKLDMMGSNVSVTKKIDDLDGILFILNYDKEPELVSYENQLPQTYISAYPDRINPQKDEASIVEFSVIMGKNPIASWKLILSKKDNSGRKFAVQKLEGTDVLSSQILFNGREKILGDYYEDGEYEFSLDASDVKGNTSFSKKTIYITGSTVGEKKEGVSVKSKDITPKKIAKVANNNAALKSKNSVSLSKVFYKIYFETNTFKITKNSLLKLEQLANTYKDYPKSKIVLIGYGYVKEQKPKTAAYKRANAVKNWLVKNYKIDVKKIIIETKVVNIKKIIVEASLK
ncbi:MAG: hypothetical protein K6357_04280 [Elusimicrobiota bacterium]